MYCYDIPLVLLYLTFLFVSDGFTIVILFPADCSKWGVLLLFPVMQTTLHLFSGNTHSAGGLVNVNANTNQQTKTKEHNMDPPEGQSHYTCSVCPLFCLEFPLGHIMTASHFSFKGPQRLSSFGCKSTAGNGTHWGSEDSRILHQICQEKSRNCKKGLRSHRYRALFDLCCLLIEPPPPPHTHTHVASLPFIAKCEQFNP